jgi:ubiquinone/menaquinone biosynthesis C-methylase UbiE
MTDVAANFVGSIPEHYDRFLGPRIFSSYAREITARVVSRQPNSVLELAAGTGIVSRELRNSLPVHCALLVSDLNSPMLDIAQAKFRPEENVVFEPADATALSFVENGFDSVVCQFGVMFFPHKEKSYSEVRRVLKPGGHYIFSVWGSWEQNPFAELAHKAVADLFPNNPPGFYKVPFGYHDEGLIHNQLMAAGFTSAEFETIHLSSDIPSSKNFARGLVFGNPLLEEIIARGGDPEIVCSAIAMALDDNLGSSMPLQAVIITAS